MYLKLSDSPCEVRLSYLDFVVAVEIRQWCLCCSVAVFTMAALVIVQEQSLGNWRKKSF